jgi:hypothetical protein
MLLDLTATACLTALRSTEIMTTSPILILGGLGKTGRRVATLPDASGIGFRPASRSSRPHFDWYDESTWVARVQYTDTAGRRIDYLPLTPDEHVSEMIGYGLRHPDAEALRDLFAVIRHHRSEYVSDGVRQVLARTFPAHIS